MADSGTTTAGLAEATQRRLGLNDGEVPVLTPILKGGSDRTFHRVTMKNRGPVILMHYSLQREENAYWAEIAQFLHGLGVRVPRVLGHDAEQGLVWVEDLGTVDLHSQREMRWTERRRLYVSTLDTVIRLHDAGLEAARAAGLRLMPGFDSELYAWERNYFFERFVHGACALALAAQEKSELDKELIALAGELMGHPPCLVHRDFQSQNVLIKDGEAWLIDFQGMRVGTRFYDLGSLLFDPYVPFTAVQRMELMKYYQANSQGVAWAGDGFERAFCLASAQRLMQALGAYGYLGFVKGKRGFLAHIEPALKNLREACRRSGSLPCLLRLVDRCEAAWLRRLGTAE
jgi:hypothetical protein